MINKRNTIQYNFLIFLLFLTNVFAQNKLSEVNSWAYQLQNANIDEIAQNSTFDLIVIDYSSDGTEEFKYSVNQITKIKNSGKFVLAYISIGEAEDYRFYWKNNWDANNDGIPDFEAPKWLGNENPNWDGNFKVRFWEKEWQNIIFSWIDTIIAQGFNGIYCDIIDAYYYWQAEIGTEPMADKYMVEFLANIREFILTKTLEPFYIFPQNGEFIIVEENVTEELKQKYFSAIDAIGIEDIFFNGNKDENNVYNPDNERLNILNEFKSNGKQVFSIEYLDQPSLIEKYLLQSKNHNFIPYVNDRNLDKLNDGFLVSVLEEERQIHNSFKLEQNYPNPFNPSTKIKFTVPAKSNVEIVVFNLQGEKLMTLLKENLDKGNYDIHFNASSLTSGIYFYQLKAKKYIETNKMIYLK